MLCNIVSIEDIKYPSAYRFHCHCHPPFDARISSQPRVWAPGTRQLEGLVERRGARGPDDGRASVRQLVGAGRGRWNSRMGGVSSMDVHGWAVRSPVALVKHEPLRAASAMRKRRFSPEMEVARETGRRVAACLVSAPHRNIHCRRRRGRMGRSLRVKSRCMVVVETRCCW